MTDKNLEAVSALLDNEASEQEVNEVFERISERTDDVDAYTRYGLIGDVLRNEQHVSVDDSFASNIQSAIANLEQEQSSSNVVSLSNHPKWRGVVDAITQSTFGKVGAQFAIAASVALVAVVGVNNMNTESGPMNSPVLSTAPLFNGVSPVSVGSQGEQKQESANQLTQKRINALIADHKEQLKSHNESEKEEAKKDK